MIRETIHKDLVFTLLKLFDDGSDDLSFPRVLLFPNLAQISKNQDALKNLSQRVQASLVSEPLRSLRILRNKILAHNDTRGATQTVVYGHAPKVLIDAVYCSEQLASVAATLPPFADSTNRVWQFEADRFWKAIIAGAPPAPSIDE